MTTLSLPVACMSVLAIAGSALAGPSITNLGSVNGRLVLPTGISADGTTVVGNTADVLNTRPVRWTAATGAVDIGPPDQSSYAYAGAANADGSVIVGFDTGPGGATPVGSRWTASNGYQALPLPPGASNAYANGVNADGSVVVGHAGIGTAFRAYRWTSGSGYQLLPVAAGYTGEWGTGVSADGSVVVGNHTASNGFSDQAFRYTASAGYQNLGIQQGFGRSTARAVSGDGNTVVGLSQAIGSSITGAFRWTAETGLVPLFFDAESSSYATGVTFDGSRIVGSSVLNGNQIAVMWTSTLGNLDLNTYLPTLGINLTGWNLQSVQGISADGTILTGSGTFNGEEAGWVVSTVPAPSAAPLLALGGLLASRRRRRHIAL